MKTLVLFYPGCIESEVMLACEILDSKYPVEVITPDGADHLGPNGVTYRANHSLASVDIRDCKVALFPGGDPGILIGNENLNQLIRNLNSNQVVLGAICAGPIILEQAGILKNRKIAHGYKRPQLDWLLERGFFKNTELTNDSVLIEDHIVTARPESFVDFAIEVAVLAGAIENSKKSDWKRFYKDRSV